MLASMRSTSNSFIVKMLILLLVASFALWGIEDMMKGQTTISVATVGGESISEQEYVRELMKLRTNLGEYFTPEIIKKLRLFDLSLGDLISDKLILQEAHFMHLTVGEEMLKEALAIDPQFKNDKGVFDRTIFDQRLRQLRTTEKEYLAHASATLKQTMLEQTLSPAPIFDETLVNTLYSIQEEEREVLAFIVNQTGDAVIPTPTEEELRVYYEANKSTYIAPEYRVLNYILLDKTAVTDSVMISEDTLRDAYLKRQKELMTPEKRDVLQLLYAEKAMAEQAYGMLRAGKSFATVTHTLNPINLEATSLGFVTKNQLPAASDAVFSLNTGAFTTPVKTEFGWHIFYVQEIQPSTTPSFEALKEQLRDELKQQNVNQTLAQMVEKFEDSVAAGMSFTDIAASMKLKIVSTDAIDSHGQRSDNTVALDIVQLSALMEVSFALEEGKTSDVGRLADGGYFVVQPSQITAQRQRALEEVRGFVAADWTQEQKRRATRDYGATVNKALSGVDSVEKAKEILKKRGISAFGVMRAKRAGMTTKKMDAFQLESIKEGFIDSLFEQAEPYDSLVLTPYEAHAFLGGIYLNTRDKTADQVDERYGEIKQRLTRLYEQEISQQYLASLQKRFPVTRNQEVLKRVMERF